MKTPQHTYLLHGLLWIVLLWPGAAFASTEAPEAKNSLETLYSLEAMALPHAFDPDTMPYDSTESKLKYYDKLGHWFEAYQYAHDYFQLSQDDAAGTSGFLDSQQVAFKRHTFINTYVEPEIRHPNWMFWMTNRITKAKNPHKVAPYIILQPAFTPTDTSFTAYTVSLQLTGSADIAGHIGQIERKINEEQLKGLTASSPQGFKEALDEALGQTLSELTEFIGRSFAPPVAIGYEGSILSHGDQINFYEGMAETFTLQSLDRDLQPLDDARVSWQNASKQGSIATVSMQGVNRKEVSLSYRGHTSIITIVRKGDLFDLRSIVKEQLLAVLQPRKAQHQDTLRVRQEALGRIDARLVDQLSLIEAGNLAIVPETTQERQALFDSPLLITDSSTFQEEPKRTAGFALLREKKGLEAQVRKRLNILAFVDLVVDQPEALDDLVDAIIRDSGRLLARLIFEQSSQGQEGRVRNIVTDYLNANIEALANSSSVAVTAVPLQLPVVVVENPPVADASRSLIYINPLIPMPPTERDALRAQLHTYLSGLDAPVFVNVRYSQDISEESYRQRSSTGRPVGLPEGHRYLTIDYLNIPGSITAQLLWGDDEQSVAPEIAPGSTAEMLEALIKARTGGEGSASGEDDPAARISARLRDLAAATQFQYIAILHCEDCQQDTVNISETANIQTFSEAGIGQEVRIPIGGQGEEGAPALIADRIERLADACLLVYLRPAEQTQALGLSYFSEASASGEQRAQFRRQLTVFDQQNQSQALSCDAHLGDWGQALCSAGEDLASTLDATYFDGLFGAVEACTGVGEEPVAVNFAFAESHEITAEAVETLLGGSPDRDQTLSDERGLYDFAGLSSAARVHLSQSVDADMGLILTGPATNEQTIAGLEGFSPKGKNYHWVHIEQLPGGSYIVKTYTFLSEHFKSSMLSNLCLESMDGKGLQQSLNTLWTGIQSDQYSLGEKLVSAIQLDLALKKMAFAYLGDMFTEIKFSPAYWDPTHPDFFLQDAALRAMVDGMVPWALNRSILYVSGIDVRQYLGDKLVAYKDLVLFPVFRNVAFIAGVWDGLMSVGQVLSGIGQAEQALRCLALTLLVDDDYRREFQAQMQTLTALVTTENIQLIGSLLWSQVEAAVAKEYEGFVNDPAAYLYKNRYQAHYILGNIAFEVLLEALTAGTATGIKMAVSGALKSSKLVVKLITFLQRARPYLSYLNRLMARGLLFIRMTADETVGFALRRGGEILIEITEDGILAVRKTIGEGLLLLDEYLFEPGLLLLPDGTVARQRSILQIGEEGLNILQATEADEALIKTAREIRDASGLDYATAKKVARFPAGKHTEIITLAKALKERGFRQTDELLADLLDDGDDLLRALLDDVELADSWAALMTVGKRVNNQPAGHGIRLSPEFLRKFKALSSTDKQKILSYLDKQKAFKGRKGEVDYVATKDIDGIGEVKIKYDKNGFPDFFDYCPIPREKFVFIADDLNGNASDFRRANQFVAESFGFKKPFPRGPDNKYLPIKSDGYQWTPGTQNFYLKKGDEWVKYTWHHHQDGKSLIPVESRVHSTSEPGNSGFPHSGGDALIEEGLQGLFESPKILD